MSEKPFFQAVTEEEQNHDVQRKQGKDFTVEQEQQPDCGIFHARSLRSQAAV